jgi:hypothetical protein
MALPSNLLGLEQCPDENVGDCDNNAGNIPGKDTQFGQSTNQFHHPPGYSYPSLLPPFTGTLQFYHHSRFIMPPSWQPSSGGATHGYPGNGQSWP